MRNFIRQNLIALSISMAAVMAVGIGLMLIGQTLQSHLKWQRSREVHEAIGTLLGTASLLARERGLTALLLGAHPAPEVLDDLARVRAQARAGWQEVLTFTGRIGSRFDNPQPLEQASRRSQHTHAALEVARARVDMDLDAGAPGLSGREWWRISTEHNLSCAQLRDQLLSADFLVTEGAGLTSMLMRMTRDLGAS